jgi:hypothetical protein
MAGVPTVKARAQIAGNRYFAGVMSILLDLPGDSMRATDDSSREPEEGFAICEPFSVTGRRGSIKSRRLPYRGVRRRKSEAELRVGAGREGEGADALAGGGEDRVAERRTDRRHAGFTDAGGLFG